jgi:hypothetical protein
MVVGGKTFMRTKGIPRMKGGGIACGKQVEANAYVKDLAGDLEEKFKMERAARWLIGSPSI